MEWVARISKRGEFYYIRVPRVYGEKYHRCKVRVVVQVLRCEEKKLKLRVEED